MTDVAFDAINDALDRCADLGFEMVPGFATHWAMGSETMIELGHADLVPTWVDLYRVKHKHYPRPAADDPINGADESSWRAALGAFERAGDWQRYFGSELRERPWREVLEQWWPRLIPGVSAGLTHGLIRTTHIVRSFARSPREQPTAAQLGELSTGLSYWAGRYVEQPAPAILRGSQGLPEILRAIPRLDQSIPMKLHDKGLFRHMPAVDGWGDAVSELAAPGDIQGALSDVTAAFAQVNLVHGDQFPIPLVHTVTAPAALRMMLPHLPEHLHAPSFVAVWQAAAALLTTFAPARDAETSATWTDGDRAVLPEKELAERAVEHGDEHAMKFTEACLREYRIRPDRRYLLAAEQMQGRIPRYFRGSQAVHVGTARPE
jgi:hypothetical protein